MTRNAYGNDDVQQGMKTAAWTRRTRVRIASPTTLVAGVGAFALILAGCGIAEDGPRSDSTLSASHTSQGRSPDSESRTVEDPAADGEDVLVITVTGTGVPRTMTLTCSPPGGDHPTPQLACAALDAFLDSHGAQHTAVPTGCPRPGPPTPPSGQSVTVSGIHHGEHVSLHVMEDDCDGTWGALTSLIAPLNAG